MNNFSQTDLNDPGIRTFPRLILLVGYLGGEKLKLLHQFVDLLKQTNRYVAIIENHKGQHSQSQNSVDCDYLITEISDSMIRCKLIGDFKKTVSDILEVYQADFIIFDCLGSLDTSLFYRQLDEIKQIIRYDSLTTVIDCLTAEVILEDNSDAQDQVKAADILLVVKKELLNEIRVQHLVQLLRGHNTTAPIISMNQESFDPMLLYGNHLLKYQEVPKNSGNQKDHNNQIGDICDRLSAIRLDLQQTVLRKQFEDKIEEIPKNILRIEGILKFSGENCPVYFQYISGRYNFRNYPFPAFKNQFLVVVGKNLERFQIKFLNKP
ncbi:MAG: hypothetical protein HOD92_26695 [Deltaproteobacteria bacterium]|jgi:G3E family GTPase|nr:hypothetical protein [Deltaproteobacteria bacterium]